MGWNWAMWISQRVHQLIALGSSGLSESRLLVDGRPAPDLSDGVPILIPYADNFNVGEWTVKQLKQPKMERSRG